MCFPRSQSLERQRGIHPVLVSDGAHCRNLGAVVADGRVPPGPICLLARDRSSAQGGALASLRPRVRIIHLLCMMSRLPCSLPISSPSTIVLLKTSQRLVNAWNHSWRNLALTGCCFRSLSKEPCKSFHTTASASLAGGSSLRCRLYATDRQNRVRSHDLRLHLLANAADLELAVDDARLRVHAWQLRQLDRLLVVLALELAELIGRIGVDKMLRA